MYMKSRFIIAIAALISACSESTSPSNPSISPSLGKMPAPSNATSTWKLPMVTAGLGLTSDGRESDGTFSNYSDGVCGVTSTIFTDGSGDATVQTNNPRAKNSTCQSARTMTLVYGAGDPTYPNGGTETMEVFLNLHNISNSTTTIAVGYANRVERQLGLNPTQRERCDAWRWTNTSVPGDPVWVERIDATTYHVYTKDRDPDPALAAANATNNKAICTTTGQAHHLSVDLYVVSKQSLPAIISLEPSFARSAAAPVHQLAGGGKIDLAQFDLFPETYAFSASVNGDGHVRGQAEIRLSDPLVSFHAQVTCLSVSGNSAWVGGVVTETSDLNIAPEGMQFWLRVLDNGDGNASNPDKISSVRLGAPSSVCNQQRPVRTPWVFFRGDLTVR